MKHFHRTFTLKSHRLFASFLILFLLISSGLSQGRKQIRISSMMQPSLEAGIYFRGHGSLGGGVVPRGAAQFIGPENSVLNIKELQLAILDEKKFRNRRTDYDAIGIRYQDEIYELSAPDDMIYPLMKFIQRGSFIIYTLPVAGVDKKYFDSNALRPYRSVRLPTGSLTGYVAKEFVGSSHAALLEATDFAETVRISKELQDQIISKLRVGRGDFTGVGSYVNADFHVRYKVFLEVEKEKRVANVGGLPLRYFWYAATEGRAVKVFKVEVFRFPKQKFSLQDRSVMFFQTTAILRQFYNTNRAEFNRFLLQVERLGA